TVSSLLQTGAEGDDFPVSAVQVNKSGCRACRNRVLCGQTVGEEKCSTHPVEPAFPRSRDRNCLGPRPGSGRVTGRGQNHCPESSRYGRHYFRALAGRCTSTRWQGNLSNVSRPYLPDKLSFCRGCCWRLARHAKIIRENSGGSMGKRLGIYIFNGAEVIDWAGPAGVFAVARRMDPELDIFLIGDSLVPVTTTANISINPRYGLDQQPDMDAFLIPGGIGT